MLVCPVCGSLRAECSDPDRPWYPQRNICYATRQQAAADRMYDEKHHDRPFHDGTERRWAEKHATRTPFHFRDGVRIWVAPVDLNPDDKFI